MRTGPLRRAARFGRFVHERPRRWAARNEGLVLALAAVLEVLQVLVVDPSTPARTVAVRHRRVESQTRDHQERVAWVGVHGEPVTLALLGPVHVSGGVHRRVDEMTAVEGLADRARAVVAARLEARVPTAVAVARAHDVVRRLDHLLDSLRGAIGDRRPMVVDLRFAVGGAPAAVSAGSCYRGPA